VLAVVAGVALLANVYLGVVTRRMAIATKVAAEATERAGQLGNAYRFVPYKVEADVWRPGDTRPSWLQWYEERRKELELV
jgi:hypothetical protein